MAVKYCTQIKGFMSMGGGVKLYNQYRLLNRNLLHNFERNQLQPAISTRIMSSMSTQSSDAAISESQIKLVEDINKLIIDKELIQSASRSNKVVEFNHPQQLGELLDLPVGKDGVEHKDLYAILQKVLQYSVHTGHPRFLNQQYAGRDIYGMLGSFITEAINAQVHTFEVAPVLVVVEKYMIEKLNQYIGYPQEMLDGIFTPGGSLATMFAMHLARFKWNNDIKQQGMIGQPRLSIFTSQEAHYSVTKGASFLGFGLQSVYVIKTDDRGKMDPDELEAKITESKNKGEHPLLVSATCGSTVLGSFDPLCTLADIADKHNMWFHVDAAWGGSVLVSEKHRHLMNGIEKADSVLWNTHKMLGAPVQCSTLILRHKGLLSQCFAGGASYLFQTDKFYDISYDTGDKTVQCGRKGDALKLWTMWKARGDEGMANIVDKAMDNAKYLTEKLRTREGFRLVMPQYEFANISFWYIPPKMRGKPETEEWWKDIAKVAPMIKEKMVKEGTLMVGFQPLEHKNLVNFFRVIIESPAVNYSDMDFVINEIERLGQDL